jgi:hypothetical protein
MATSQQVSPFALEITMFFGFACAQANAAVEEAVIHWRRLSIVHMVH